MLEHSCRTICDSVGSASTALPHTCPRTRDGVCRQARGGCSCFLATKRSLSCGRRTRAGRSTSRGSIDRTNESFTPRCSRRCVDTRDCRCSSECSGLGSAVIAAGLQVLDRDGAQVSLETSDDRNVRFYQRHGFSLDATISVPDGPLVHSMSRSARR